MSTQEFSKLVSDSAVDVNSAVDSIFDDELFQVLPKELVVDTGSIFIDNQWPVDPIEFATNTDYLGGMVDLDTNVLDIIYQVEDARVRQAYLELGKGSGKTEIASFSTLYGAYLCGLLRNPQRFFGLGLGTLIASVNLSIGRKQAKSVVFQSIKTKWKASPWFHDRGGEALTEEIIMPNEIHVFCGHSGSSAFLGFATIRAVLDEVNFMVNNDNRNVAEDLLDTIMGSALTRYPNYYKIIGISSTGLPGAPLTKRVDRVLKEGEQFYARQRREDKRIKAFI